MEILNKIKSAVINPKLTGYAIKLQAIKNARPRIALLTEGAEDRAFMSNWTNMINQYAKIAIKHPSDALSLPDITIVCDANLTSESWIKSTLRDSSTSEWFNTRTKSEKAAPTIYCGKSGLVFAEMRNTQTIVLLKQKGFMPIFKPENRTRGPESKADHFVDAAGCYGIRRISLPEGAEVLYTTPVKSVSKEGPVTEEFVVGFKINNNICLLFHPERLTNSESRTFFHETQCRFGSETFLDAIYSLSNPSIFPV